MVPGGDRRAHVVRDRRGGWRGCASPPVAPSRRRRRRDVPPPSGAAPPAVAIGRVEPVRAGDRRGVGRRPRLRADRRRCWRTPASTSSLLTRSTATGWSRASIRDGDLKDPTKPCDGAVERQHSHFFTADGAFGSKDFDGQQVDDGTYTLEGNDGIVINGKRFTYEVQGDELVARARACRRLDVHDEGVPVRGDLGVDGRDARHDLDAGRDPAHVTHAPRSLVAAIDQGTTSSRCILFDHAGGRSRATSSSIGRSRRGPAGSSTTPTRSSSGCGRACGSRSARPATDAGALAAVGISNQRETTVVWDRRTGRPVHPAIVWQDTRTADAVERLAAEGGMDRFRATTGLPVSTYSSALKLRWILDASGAIGRPGAGWPSGRSIRGCCGS